MNRAFADVYECFSWEGMECLAVERVDLPDVASWINAASDSEQQSRTDMACEGVASALDWLLNLPAPLGAQIGLLQGAYFFGKWPRTSEKWPCSSSILRRL